MLLLEYDSGGRDRTCDPTHVSGINPMYIGLSTIEKPSFQMDRTASCQRNVNGNI
ncbi:MAG: hypothetical protein P8L82_04490 [Paracoccaceae bacterium]|nr:hypothetical protein [Paracoccaceae bacterium]